MALVLYLLGRFSGIIIDWLWFGEMGYSMVFDRLPKGTWSNSLPELII